MAFVYVVPRWFFGYDVFLELMFAAVTFLVALYSFYIYRISGQRQCGTLGAGFLLLSGAYVSWALVNLLGVPLAGGASHTLSLGQLSLIGDIGVYAHVGLFLLGLSALAYMTFGVRQYRLFSLIATLSLLVVIFSAYKALAFYFVSSFLILLVFMHYLREYRRTERFPTLLLVFAFLFLFVGTLEFTLATIYGVHYAVGHVLHFIGYLGIASSFLLTLKAKK